MLCFVLALGSISISLSHSLSLFLSPFKVFVVDIILTVIVEYFWDLHCLAVWLLCVTFVYSFWYLQLCLFYFCLSGATILTVINNGIFLLVFALFVWVYVFPLSYCLFFNLFICLLA